MAEMLKHRDMEKYYLCIVKGKIEGSQKVSAYLKKDEKQHLIRLMLRISDETDITKEITSLLE